MLKYIVIAVMVGVTLVIACGSEPVQETTPTPPVDPAYAEIAGIVAANCGVCHNGSVHPFKIEDGAALKRAKSRIVNGTMPPAPRRLKDADKKAMLDYIKA
jgi:mono/diheme cytochrome c family protein